MQAVHMGAFQSIDDDACLRVLFVVDVAATRFGVVDDTSSIGSMLLTAAATASPIVDLSVTLECHFVLHERFGNIRFGQCIQKPFTLRCASF